MAANILGRMSLISAATLTFTPNATQAADSAFSFRSVEYMPLEQREPRARAFLREQVPLGLPVATAVARVRRAGATCRPETLPDHTIRCSYTSIERLPDEQLDDITWVVEITSGADRTVVAASVRRRKSGF
jgi:hypothetical protein